MAEVQIERIMEQVVQRWDIHREFDDPVRRRAYVLQQAVAATSGLRFEEHAEEVVRRTLFVADALLVWMENSAEGPA